MPVVSDGIAVVVLAAGRGSRLGGGKLLLPWRGKPIIRHVVDSALTVRGGFPVVLVCGHDADAIRSLLAEGIHEKESIHIVESGNWSAGQSSSLKAGFAAALELPGADRLRGVMIMLGDQPLIKRETLAALAASHLDSRDPPRPPKATAPFADGRRGNPVILSPALFSDIMKLEGDVGAREILNGLGNGLNRVEVNDPGIFLDIDTAENYEQLLRR